MIVIENLDSEKLCKLSIREWLVLIWAKLLKVKILAFYRG